MEEINFLDAGLLTAEGHDVMLHDSFSDEIKQSKDIVVLNVGGTRFHVLKSNFAVWPATRLSRLVRARSEEEILNLCDGFIPDLESPSGRCEYFFNRNWTTFNSILDIYRRGKLHGITASCAMTFHDDLDYWGIDELFLDPCCALKYYPERENCQNELEGERLAKEKEAQRQKEEDFGTSRLGKIRKLLWNLTEYPETSYGARIFGFLSLAVVLLSTLTFVLQTLPSFEEGSTEFPIIVRTLEIIDQAAVFFFTFEYLIRFICSPVKWRFFKGPMNMVDLFAITPFYLTLALDSMEDLTIIGKAGKLIRLVRVLRIMRIFKLVRHFAGLQSLIYTLNQAYQELGLLMLLVCLSILTFSVLVFFVEKDGEEPWTFVDSLWWGIMTLTTVGNDTKGPASTIGKIIGGICAILGVFILSLPIPIVVNSFANCYKNRVWRNEVGQKRAQKLEQQKNYLKNLRDGENNISTINKNEECEYHDEK